MKLAELKQNILCSKYDPILTEKTGVSEGALEETRNKLCELLDTFGEYYEITEDRDVYLFSVGGRSEISGNHTDHNCGKVVAASVNLSVLAAVSPTDDGTIRLKSRGFPQDTVELSKLGIPCEESYFTSKALIEGTLRSFIDKGLKVGGFDAYTVSDVLKGSGLSSSAAFEVTVGKILSYLYNGDSVSPVDLAKTAQFAENVYFGKPCGLMDQAACASGGLITVDFESSEEPMVKKLDFDITEKGYSLCIVDTGGCHALLNDEYAAVPDEMKSVARFFGKDVLRQITEKDVLENLSQLRLSCGDRAVLRALHFFEENDRVDRLVGACRQGDTDKFLDAVTESGNSSFKYLQNIYPVSAYREQGLSLALFLSEKFISESCTEQRGACRVHGGGFAGTVQAFIPADLTDGYKAWMEAAFGKGCCYVLGIRKEGAVAIE